MKKNAKNIPNPDEEEENVEPLKKPRARRNANLTDDEKEEFLAKSGVGLAVTKIATPPPLTTSYEKFSSDYLAEELTTKIVERFDPDGDPKTAMIKTSDFINAIKLIAELKASKDEKEKAAVGEQDMDFMEFPTVGNANDFTTSVRVAPSEEAD